MCGNSTLPTVTGQWAAEIDAGRYTLHIQSPEFGTLVRELEVGRGRSQLEECSLLPPATIRVISADAISHWRVYDMTGVYVRVGPTNVIHDPRAGIGPLQPGNYVFAWTAEEHVKLPLRLHESVELESIAWQFITIPHESQTVEFSLDGEQRASNLELANELR